MARESAVGGHAWHMKSLTKFTWCDACGEFMWGLALQGYGCRRCKAKCHTKCIERMAPCTGVPLQRPGAKPPSPSSSRRTSSSASNPSPPSPTAPTAAAPVAQVPDAAAVTVATAATTNAAPTPSSSTWVAATSPTTTTTAAAAAAAAPSHLQYADLYFAEDHQPQPTAPAPTAEQPARSSGSWVAAESPTAAARANPAPAPAPAVEQPQPQQQQSSFTLPAQFQATAQPVPPSATLSQLSSSTTSSSSFVQPPPQQSSSFVQPPYTVPSSRSIPLVGGVPPQTHPIMVHAADAPVSPNATVTGLPSNWELRMDPRTQRWYYVDHATRQTHWNLPANVLSQIVLPAGWEARVDTRTGKLYYLNHSTRTTSWDYPLASNPSSLPATPSLSPSGGGGDHRVTELVSMGFSREVAIATAGANPNSTVPELVEFLLLRAKQQGHDVPLPARASPASGAAGAGPTDENKLCKVCMEREIDVVILKCGHMCVCMDCGKKLRECPICRGAIAELIRIFHC